MNTQSIYIVRCTNGSYAVVGSPSMVAEARARSSELWTVDDALAFAKRVNGITGANGVTYTFDLKETEIVNGFMLDVRAYSVKPTHTSDCRFPHASDAPCHPGELREGLR